MSRVLRTHQADRDIIQIGIWIGAQNRTAARRFLAVTEKTLQRLADMPALGGVCESEHLALAELRVWSIRGFPKYLILYRPLDNGIEVVRVVHGSRDLENLVDS